MKKEELLKNIKKEFESLNNYTKDLDCKLEKKNEINKEIENTEKKVSELIKKSKIDRNEYNNLNEEEKNEFIQYYNNNYNKGGKTFKQILEEEGNNCKNAEDRIKKLNLKQQMKIGE